MEAKPNVILILIDDMAWNGTSVQMSPSVAGSRSDFYQTPNLEAMAAAGMRFSSGYSSAPVCASTRAAIQAGKSPGQLQISDLPHAAIGSDRFNGIYTRLPLTPPAPETFDPDTLTIPRIVKQTDANYVTGHIGKWHLDVPTTTTPAAVGYDVGLNPTRPPDSVDPWGVFAISDAANNFMTDRVTNDEPFFLQISHFSVHSPIRSRPEIRQKYENLPPGTIHNDPAYAAMTEDLDTAIGTVLDKVSELGIDDNTYVIFTSDNGAPLALSSNAPLREGKATIREGGIRVPFIVQGPGIEAGSVSDIPVTTTDIYSTVAKIAGHSGALPEGVEGADLLPVLENGGQLPEGVDHLERQLHEGGEVYFHSPHNNGIGPVFRIRPSSSVRDGDYKLLRVYGENGQPDHFGLFNLANDIGETTNLASQMPEKTEELRLKLENYLDAIDASLPYDVKEDTLLEWRGDAPGIVANEWRSTIDVDYKGRETWRSRDAADQPQLQAASRHQPNLPTQAFSFDGDDVLNRKFFHVGDVANRYNTPNAGTPDFNRSTALEMWVRFDSLAQEHVLFESGGTTHGLSLTLGDADADGVFNDLRLRVLGQNGESLTATVPIDRFALPTRDFAQLVGVFNDDDDDRYVEIYVNGARVARVDGLLGAEHSLEWDDDNGAGLGNAGREARLNPGGSQIGGAGGDGDLPFTGGLSGEISLVRFWNHVIDGEAILANYNASLHPTTFGIAASGGDAATPAIRPASVAEGMFGSDVSVQVFQERTDQLDAPLSVDVAPLGGEEFGAQASQTLPGGLLASNTSFTSYLIHYDPETDPAVTEFLSGSVTFDSPILGIIVDELALGATDALLGVVGEYATTQRMIELTEDMFSVSLDRLTLDFSLGALGDQIVQLRILTEALLQGDFDGNGIVDEADYELWRSEYGVVGASPADGNSDGRVDAADYTVWRDNFGAGLASVNQSAAPEPASWMLVALLLGLTANRRRLAL